MDDFLWYAFPTNSLLFCQNHTLDILKIWMIFCDIFLHQIFFFGVKITLWTFWKYVWFSVTCFSNKFSSLVSKSHSGHFENMFYFPHELIQYGYWNHNLNRILQDKVHISRGIAFMNIIFVLMMFFQQIYFFSFKITLWTF